MWHSLQVTVYALFFMFITPSRKKTSLTTRLKLLCYALTQCLYILIKIIAWSIWNSLYMLKY